MFRPKMLVASLTAVRRSASLVNGLIARTASLIWLLSLQKMPRVRRAPRPLRRVIEPVAAGEPETLAPHGRLRRPSICGIYRGRTPQSQHINA